jgi:hypothetical protein
MRQLNKRNSLLALFFVAALLAVSSGAFAQVGGRDAVVTDCTRAGLDAAVQSQIVAGGTITFNCANPLIDITADINLGAGGTVVIDGANGGNQIVLDVSTTGNDSRIFDLNGAVTLTLRNITLQGGSIPAGGVPGGAIRVQGGADLNLESVIVRDNTVGSGNGGAISIGAGSAGDQSNVNVFRSAFLNNTTGGDGGVFSAGSNVNLNVAHSTFSNNGATDQGGVLRITGGTNNANFTNNTFVGNTAANGTVISSAVAAGNVQLRNNIITAAAAGAVFCEGTVGTAAISTGNVFFNGACTGVTPLITANPNLVDNTAQAIPHYALQAGSPALDVAVDTTYISDGTNPFFAEGGAINIDQPGTVRPQGAGVDAGSFEFVQVAPNTNTPVNTATTAATSTTAPTITPDPTATTDPGVTPTETATTDPNVTPTETATTDPNATATSTTDPNVTPTETATTDPNVTPTETATTDPNVTPTETATTDPNVTPTVAVTATNTEVPVPGAFDLLTPPNNAIVRDPAAITAITWGVATGGDSYRFILFKLSSNTRIGVALDLPGLTAAEDADPLTCAAVCTLTVDPSISATITDGQYAWSVFASNSFGETEATNAPFFFTVNTGAIELVVNGGFELSDLAGGNVLAPWAGRNLAGDKIKCNKTNRPGGLPDKIIAFEGDCAFQFKGSAGENSRIQQNLDFAGLVNATDVLTFSLYVDSNNALGKLGTLKIRYAEGNAGQNDNGKDKIDLRLSAPSAGGDYEQLSDTVTVDGTVTNLRVQVRNRATSGKFRIDNVSVTVGAAAPVTPTAEATSTVEATATVDATTTPDATGTPGVTETATVEATGTDAGGLLPLP